MVLSCGIFASLETSEALHCMMQAHPHYHVIYKLLYFLSSSFYFLILPSFEKCVFVAVEFDHSGSYLALGGSDIRYDL